MQTLFHQLRKTFRKEEPDLKKEAEALAKVLQKSENTLSTLLENPMPQTTSFQKRDAEHDDSNQSNSIPSIAPCHKFSRKRATDVTDDDGKILQANINKSALVFSDPSKKSRVIIILGTRPEKQKEGITASGRDKSLKLGYMISCLPGKPKNKTEQPVLVEIFNQGRNGQRETLKLTYDKILEIDRRLGLIMRRANQKQGSSEYVLYRIRPINELGFDMYTILFFNSEHSKSNSALPNNGLVISWCLEKMLIALSEYHKKNEGRPHKDAKLENVLLSQNCIDMIDPGRTKLFTCQTTLFHSPESKFNTPAIQTETTVLTFSLIQFIIHDLRRKENSIFVDIIQAKRYIELLSRERQAAEKKITV